MPETAGTAGKYWIQRKHLKYNQVIDRGKRSVLFFFANTETLEAKVKPEGAPTESGEAENPRKVHRQMVR